MRISYVDDIDEWLWGAGFERCRVVDHISAQSPRVSSHFPEPYVEPLGHDVRCAKCGGLVPLENHFALDGLPYHGECLPQEAQRFIHWATLKHQRGY